MHEAHEIVHTTIGRIICGCWGERDFNVWGFCEGCLGKQPIALFATFAGPIFTFVMIWIGTLLISKTKSENQKSFGFSLIFANIPFARILTASIGNGDEVWGLYQLINNYNMAWAVGFISIVAITIYPLWKSYQLIENKKKILWFLGFFLLPTLIDILLVLGVMNFILENGVLNKYWILGSPVLVTIWTAFIFGLYLLTRKNIYKLTEK